MTLPSGPPLDQRRTPEFLSELRERSRSWIPAWDLSEGKRDFGQALLEIAARFSAEVAERFDRGADKMERGFFDWLAVRGKAAIPARMPVVFKLADTTIEARFAPNPVRMQAEAGGTPVAFETETELNIVPGKLDRVVAVDADKDALYLPWPGLSDLQPLDPMPTQWLLKNFASAGSSTIQLDPELGLAAGMILEIDRHQYRVETADKDLVTIQPPLESDVATGTSVSSVSRFAPFDEGARNWQEHALYLGDDELLNIEAEATIEVLGSSRLRTGFTWEYWGKSENSAEAAWRPLPIDNSRPDAIVLKKPKGAIEQKEIGGKKGRWIRAYLKTVGAGEAPVAADAFSIRINSSQCSGQKCPPDIATASPEAEAMANSTPLVLDNVFLPLGREPRLFDAFYLGSAEAFSKKGAHVSLCFEVGDTTFASLAMPSAAAGQVVAGVGRDRSLHIFKFDPAARRFSRFANRDALRPPTPAENSQAPAVAGNTKLNAQCRPVITPTASGFSILTAAERSIRTWNEIASDSKLSGWQNSDLPDSAPSRIDDIVPVSSADTIVLSESELWVHNGAWNEVPTRVLPATPVTLVALAPVWQGTNGALTAANQMVGVSDTKRLFLVSQGGACELLKLDFAGTETLVDTDSRSQEKTGGTRPAAFLDALGNLAVVTADDTRHQLVAYVQPGAKSIRIDLPKRVNASGVTEQDEVIGSTIDISIVNGTAQFAALCRRPDDTTYIALWQPLDPARPDLKNVLFQPAAPASGRLNGAPVTLPAHMVAPGTRGELFVASFDAAQRQLLTTLANREGVVLPVTEKLFKVGDEVSVMDATGDRLREAINDPVGLVGDSERLYELQNPLGKSLADELDLLMFRRSDPPFKADVSDDETITLDSQDNTVVEEGTVLVIDVAGSVDLYMVIDASNYRKVKIQPPLPATPAKADYWTPEPLPGRIAPIIALDAATGSWDAALLTRTRFYFPTADAPDSIARSAKAFTPFGAPPLLVALSAPWKSAPATGAFYVIDRSLDAWLPALADSSSSPELSWEYSNGTAWTSLPLEQEGTGHLRSTGAVRFRVPDDLAAVDWAGKINHWIRARLINGDYGKEKVTVFTDTSTNPQTQTIERSTDGIRPPSVITLHISYGFCEDILPAYLITEDSRSTRDQSDANRSVGAIVEAFVSLDVLLGRLESGPVQGVTQAIDRAPCKCGCCDEVETPTATCRSKSTSTSVSTSAPSSTVRRAVFVGLTKPPSGEPVNLLFLADTERDHNLLAPLAVKAHLRDRFVPVVADDATRGLGESELLKLAFAEEPTLRELFGDPRAWLQLTPSRGAVSDWRPSLRGAYVNGVWASATETLTRELLGSSEGAPKMTFKLARPPVLDGTLELRVREPLGEEELQQLREQDPNSVVSNVDELPGDWVLWKQVTDPGDRLPLERVYALDETTGEILFGDGLHGAIPPIDVDSIVAFSYQRTEAGAPGAVTVPGNLIRPRTALNLVTPIEGAESVIAADQSAGGAPPESPERVLRFGLTRLRHRERAVSAHDIEDIAMESSPDVAQARVFARRNYLQLVVVMRGGNPVPNAPQIRELRRLLLSAAPITLSAAGALKVSGPRTRQLRIELDVRVSSLDHAGALTRDLRRELTAFFDTVVGGTRTDGWPLGTNPREEDVAYALIDVSHLQSVVDVKFLEVGRDGNELAWPTAIKPTELVVLAEDAFRIHLQATEVAA